MSETQKFNEVQDKGKAPVKVAIVKFPLSGVRKWFAKLFGRKG